MSAAPPTMPSGRTPNGGPANGAPPRIIRRAPEADPLRRPKKKITKPQAAPIRPGQPAPGAGAKANGKSSTAANVLGKSIPVASKPSIANPSRPSNPSNPAVDSKGFSGPVPTGSYQDYDLVMSKRALSEGLRYHIARFASKKLIDPTNGEEFTRPVRLQRRDPRAPPAGGGGVKADDEKADSKEELLDEKERERLEVIRMEKEAQRQADLEQIAPRANQPAAAATKRSTAFNNKKTTQVYDHDQTPEARKRSQVRYEEALPWHLEDFDNKNTWVGAYESALSDMYVSLVGTPDAFHMVPMERWYKFTPKSHFKTLTIEEAESKMSKAVKEPRWIMDQQNALQQKKQQEAENRAGGRKLFLGKWDTVRGGGKSAMKVDPEADDLDFMEEPQDDEGPQIMEGEDEENKYAEERIKRDQLQANVFDLKDEKEYELADQEEKKQADLAKKLGKGVKKALIDREKNYIYDSDSDANPYSDESDTEKTDDEKRKEEERKKAEEKPDKSKVKENGKIPSGASSKGTNTPSGRPKHTDPLKKAGPNLKRAGSPDLSEASGAESSRKKQKKNKQFSSSQPTATSTPIAGSRPNSPPPSSAPDGRPHQRKSSVIKLSVEPSKLNDISSAAPRPEKRSKGRMGAGSGSEGEAPGGEEGKQRTKIKLRLNGSPPGGSPTGSRAGSPNPPPTAHGGSGSRAGSPIGVGSPPPNMTPVTEAEVMAAIGADGKSIQELLVALGKHRVNALPSGDFTAMVKRLATLGSDKKLRLKAASS
ncbi:MAG: hypothetical protein M1832_000574 [Thelocarpon impressellum]|nr:MAG: hypothetical protein M1832_000574 [Thelocarpon impressellum]